MVGTKSKKLVGITENKANATLVSLGFCPFSTKIAPAINSKNEAKHTI